ncbi:MAG TPA: methyltransferase domain-containing protein [Dehalococcoidia bacterium]
MDRLRFFSIIGRYKTIDNPISVAKADLVIEALRLNPASRVLDIACGKAEMLCRIAARYGASCAGVDLSPHFCAEARRKADSRGLSDLVTVEEISGDAFTAPEATFDVTMCIGAEWVFGGWTRTLTQLQRWAKPGATVVAGTPYWISPPPASYLEATGLSSDSFLTHAENVGAGESLGLNLLFAVVSNQDDWDNYVGLSWRAAYDFVRDNPNDGDRGEIEELTANDKKAYFQYARDCLGWAIYVFRRA